MTRTPVKSSFIHAVGHDPSTAELEVELKSGKVLSVPDVTAQEHAAFVSAPSLGKHFNLNFRSKTRAV